MPLRKRAKRRARGRTKGKESAEINNRCDNALGGKKILRNDIFTKDVTINDFANLRIRRRLKEAVTTISNQVKQEMMKEETSIWEETDGNLRENNRKGEGNRRKLKYQENEPTKNEGIDYPLDIWFILSEYIPPEAVGKFARICKSSYYVTTTGKFWFHLYKIYYEFMPELPERLQQQCMTRTHGLRACVIRALHYSYFTSLLQRKIDDVSYLRQEEPHSLVKRTCIIMWHKKVKIRWYFFFKLKEISKYSSNSLSRPKRYKRYNTDKTEFVEMLEDVAVNPEEGCKVLMVTCLKYSMLPPVIGLVLQTVSMNLMPGFRRHRLHLRFGTSIFSSTLTNEVILNDVIGYRILDWWDPLYPYHDTSFLTDIWESDSD